VQWDNSMLQVHSQSYSVTYNCLFLTTLTRAKDPVLLLPGYNAQRGTFHRKCRLCSSATPIAALVIIFVVPGSRTPLHVMEKNDEAGRTRSMKRLESTMSAGEVQGHRYQARPSTSLVTKTRACQLSPSTPYHYIASMRGSTQ
jgi:hypothetical protein